MQWSSSESDVSQYFQLMTDSSEVEARQTWRLSLHKFKVTQVASNKWFYEAEQVNKVVANKGRAVYSPWWSSYI